MSSKGGKMITKPKRKPVEYVLGLNFCSVQSKITITIIINAFRISHVSQTLRGRKISITTNQNFRYKPQIILQANHFMT